MPTNYSDTDLRSLQAHIDATGSSEGWKPAPRKKRKNEESATQRSLIKWWAHACKGFGVHEWLLFSIPNGGARNPIAGQFMKMEGQRRGAPDLFLASPRHMKFTEPVPSILMMSSYAGLFLELKTKDGVLSPEQRTFGQHLKEQGYAISVARSLEEAKKVITEYLT